jgi:NAD+ kinase
VNSPARKISKALVVFKKSTLQIQGMERKEPRFLKLMDEGHASVQRVQVAHDEHYQTLAVLEAELERRKIAYECKARVELNNRIVEDVDLVISVGGDGTFLDASHHIRSVPLLGINSATSSSFGHFCAGNRENLPEVLDRLLSGELLCNKLLRLQLFLNGQELPTPILNEVLICHSSPAGTSRYFIEVGGHIEEQRSSGIWIGPPAGSTAAIYAAGGTILPILERQFQYVVREPFQRPYESWRLFKGLIPETDTIKITSQMRAGAIFVDGTHIVHPFLLGVELAIKRSPYDLNAYVLPTANDIFRLRKETGVAIHDR